MNTRIATGLALATVFVALGLPPQYAESTSVVQGRSQGTGGQNEAVTFSNLPSFGRGSQALAIDGDGRTIAGTAWDRSDLLHAIKWTLQADGSWGMTDRPWPPGATSARASAVNTSGDVTGNDYPGTTSRALLWRSGGGPPVILGCGEIEPATVYSMSANAQVVVGVARGAGAAVWQPGSCRQLLPTGASADAVNGDGTIVGGAAGGMPARWTNVAGAWTVETLDLLGGIDGRALGANESGDLAGYVSVPCTSNSGLCEHSAIWYLDGRSADLARLLGGEGNHSTDINSSGEVVGAITVRGVTGGYFWSAGLGLIQLTGKGRGTTANALSNVRPDGTRLIVGMDAGANAAVWLVRNP
jgi:uncharacterized membrane protein